jgi:hypothetical protein
MSMTKAELLSDLDTKVVARGTPVEEDESYNVKTYRVNVLMESSDETAAMQKNVLFYVFDESGGSEAAWYDREKPANQLVPPTDTLYEDLITHVEAMDDLLKYTVISYEPDNSFLLARVYLSVTGKSVKMYTFLVYKESSTVYDRKIANYPT